MNANKFAAFISYLTMRSNNGSFDSIECETVSRFVNELNDIPKDNFTNPDALNILLDAMKQNRFIEAIRQYRILTNAGLKDSKDAIEKYRPYVSMPND